MRHSRCCGRFERPVLRSGGQVHPRHRVTPVLLAALSLAVLPAAHAEDTIATSESFYALYAPDTEVAPARAWRFTVGAGVVDMPTFPGADSQKTEVVPVLGASRGNFFVGANPDTASLFSLGGYLVRDARWRVGLAATYDVVQPREESDDRHLYGLGDLDRTTHGEVFAVYTQGWASLRGSVLTDLGGNDRGTLATFEAMGRFPVGSRWVLVAGPGVSFGDGKYMRAYFGIDPRQSADSGLPQYRPGSGLYNARISLGANYRPSSGWNLGANLALGWLQGDASDSPVTQRSRQTTVTVLASRTF